MERSIAAKTLTAITVLLGTFFVLWAISLIAGWFQGGWTIGDWPSGVLIPLALVPGLIGPVTALAGARMLRRAKTENRPEIAGRILLVGGVLGIAALAASSYWTVVGPNIAAVIVLFWLFRLANSLIHLHPSGEVPTPRLETLGVAWQWLLIAGAVSGSGHVIHNIAELTGFFPTWIVITLVQVALTAELVGLVFLRPGQPTVLVLASWGLFWLLFQGPWTVAPRQPMHFLIHFLYSATQVPLLILGSRVLDSVHPRQGRRIERSKA